MKKSFWIFLAIGVAVLGVLLSGVLVGTKGNHLELSGSVLKVRAMPAGSGASFVVIDFRVTNPSDIPFVVKQVSLASSTPPCLPVHTPSILGMWPVPECCRRQPI